MRVPLKNIYLSCEEFFLNLRGKKDILFVVENELMLKYACLIYDRLLKDGRLRLWFCMVYQERFHDKQKVKRQFSGKIVSYSIAKRIKWDLIFYPNHAPYFRAESPKIYIGHGIGFGKEIKGEDYLFGSKSLDEYGEVLYQKMFRHSDYIKSKIKKHYPQFDSHVKVVGSLLSDRIMSMTGNKEELYKATNLDLAKKTIFIASTWGPTALIQSQGEALVRQIPKLLNEYNVIMSIHPNNFNTVHYKGVDLAQLLSPIKDRKNLYILKQEEMGDAFLSLADLMITDFTSLGLYFPPLKRPVIFYDNPAMSGNLPSLMCEMKKVAHVVRDLSTLKDDIKKAFLSFDADQMEEFAGKIFSYQGGAWQRTEEEIYESLQLDLPAQVECTMDALQNKDSRNIMMNS